MFNAVSENDFRKKAALSFLIKETPGASNLLLDIIDTLNLPNAIQKEVFLTSPNTNEK